MKLNRKYFIPSIIILVLITFLVGYRLPYYIYKPGGADALNPIVTVNDGFTSEGDMHLVTVSGITATPFSYLWASIRPYQEITPIENVFPEGISKDAYFRLQLQMMEGSQEASKVVAYQAANKTIDIQYIGVYVVAVVEGMPAEGILQPGDKITKLDNVEIQNTNDLMDYVGGKAAGDTIQLTIEREGNEQIEEITLQKFPGETKKVGIGISLVTDREVTVDPPVNFSSGQIGGPSAGLMFSLEIYDQLTEEDLTKGYQIAGTGEIDYDGNVNRIGGIDKKVIAANNEGCEIFFAPNEGGAANSNYQIAKQTAEDIGSSIKVVPIDTFDQALDYLKQLEPKA